MINLTILEWSLQDSDFFFKNYKNSDNTYNISIFYKKEENLVCAIVINENEDIIDKWWKSNYKSIFCLNSKKLEDFSLDFKSEFISKSKIIKK